MSYTDYLGTHSKSAAAKGDAAATQVEGSLPTIEPSEEHALELQGRVQGGYPDLGEKMANDAHQIKASSIAYNSFVQAVNTTAPLLARKDVIGLELGFKSAEVDEEHPDAPVDFEQELSADQKKAIAKQSKAIKAGSMDTARLDVDAKRSGMQAAAWKVKAFLGRRVIGSLKGELAAKQGEKSQIEANIAQVNAVISNITSLVSGGITGDKGSFKANLENAANEDAKGKATDAVAGSVGGILSEIFVGEKLKQLEKEIQTLESKIAIREIQLAFDEEKETFSALTAAVKEYQAALRRYQELIDKRREEYAEVGQDADKALNGKKKDASDPVGQVMLYMSAVQEAHTAMKTNVSEGSEVGNLVATTANDMELHRHTSIQGPGGFLQPLEANDAKDIQLIKQMNKVTSGWMALALVEQQKLEKEAASAAKITGTGTEQKAY